MSRLLTETVRAWLVVVATVAFVAAVLVWTASSEDDPCVAWEQRHGEPHPKCLVQP